MLYVIAGGSGSGKSSYGEALVDTLFETFQGKKWYIATMQCFDEEMRKKIKRHQEMRSHRNFATIEAPVRLEEKILQIGAKDVVILECMSNLLANEMYDEEGRVTLRDSGYFEQLETYIVNPIKRLCEQSGAVVVITNEIFSDGIDYDEETNRYREGLGYMNQVLSQMADRVVEVVCGIPIIWKEEVLC